MLVYYKTIRCQNVGTSPTTITRNTTTSNKTPTIITITIATKPLLFSITIYPHKKEPNRTIQLNKTLQGLFKIQVEVVMIRHLVTTLKPIKHNNKSTPITSNTSLTIINLIKEEVITQITQQTTINPKIIIVIRKVLSKEGDTLSKMVKIQIIHIYKSMLTLTTTCLHIKVRLTIKTNILA